MKVFAIDSTLLTAMSIMLMLLSVSLHLSVLRESNQNYMLQNYIAPASESCMKLHENHPVFCFLSTSKLTSQNDYLW